MDDRSVYYIVIWRLYLAPAQTTSPWTFGPRGATWVFYSWFVAGVIGLSLSLYGLAGVEAGLLMESAWNVRDATRLILHADNTWSGPGGWLKTIKWALSPKNGRRRRLPSCLWFILATPSVLVFIAWPLSGLSMEMTEGYRRSPTRLPVTMTGFYYDTFNERGSNDAYFNAASMWGGGQEAPFLNQIPAVFPEGDGIPPIFLPAQAENPTEGNNWGLLLQYNCSIINRAEDFRILNQIDRSATAVTHFSGGVSDTFLDNGKFYAMSLNQTDRMWVGNLDAVIEIGYELWPGLPTDQLFGGLFGSNFGCYFKEKENITGDYPGIHQDGIFEIAMWQRLQDDILPDEVSLPYNLSLDHNITGFFGIYDAHKFHSELPAGEGAPLLQPMSAIGVQCRASGSVGNADIDGIKSSFSNFQRTDTPILKTVSRCATRFTADVPFTVMGNFNKAPAWISSIFASSTAPPPFYGTFERSRDDGLTDHIPYALLLGYLQAKELKQSMLHAYATYAVQLMYNGGQAYTTLNGSRLTFIKPNVTQFLSGSVLKPGVVPIVVPVSLFCIWALISSVLGIMFGFRRRWTETLDGHTMFRLGAELPDDARKELLKTSNVTKLEDCVALDEIPALVGDTKPEIWLGRIGLVKDVKADEEKLYE